jgi:hypothetical protein
MGSRLVVKGILFDLTKAYDVLNDGTLLAKLDCYGIRGVLNSWVRLYIAQWIQFGEITHTENKANEQNRYASTC